MWKCPICETLNEGANCMICGEAKPVAEAAPTAPTYTKGEPVRSNLKSTFASSKTTGAGHTPYRPVHSEPLTPPQPVRTVPPPVPAPTEKKGGVSKVITILIILLILVKFIASMMDTGYDEAEYSNESTSGYYDSHPQYYGE